jgi:Sulfotransferase domain
MRKPNLFVVGAPKCATTALHAYLAQHPECFMSIVKEPAYFSRAHVRDDIRRTLPHLQSEEAYLKLFSDATEVHKIVGESSTCYMRAEADLEELQAFAGNPKIVASVRDPVSLVSSYFHFLRYQGWEPLATLREAWEIQDERCAGHVASIAANRPDSLAYRNVALLGQQVERLFRLFGRENVLVLLIDDLRENTAEVCRNLQYFLGLTCIENIELPRKNVARAARVQIIDNLVKQNSRTVLQAKNRIKRFFGVRSLGIRRFIERINSSRVQHSVDTDLRDEMREYFHHDVALLGRLLERNLFELWGWEQTELARKGACKTPPEIWQ